MARVKVKTGYVCSDCGAEYPKWQGHCTACDAWNTVQEVRLAPATRREGFAGATSVVTLLGAVECTEQARFSSRLPSAPS